MKVLTKYWSGVLAAVFLLQLAMIVLVPRQVSAGTNSVTWINAGTVEYNGRYFTDPEIEEDGDDGKVPNWHFYSNGAVDGDNCPDEILGITWNPAKEPFPTTDTQYELKVNISNGQCYTSVTIPVPLDTGSAQNVKNVFAKVNDTTIKSFDGKLVFVKQNTGTINAFLELAGGCASRINDDGVLTVLAGDGNNGDGGNTDLTKKFDSYWFRNSIESSGVKEGNCWVSKPIQIQFGDDPAGSVTGPGGGSTGQAGVNDVKSCENTSGMTLNWLVCPVLEALDNIILTLEALIREMLEIRPGYYDSPQIKSAWANINRIATFGLVAAGLMMVVSTALGFSMFDAYTLRKVLPRLIIAAIGMQLSWYLCVFAIDIVNDIGGGIADVMYTPFGGREALDIASNLSRVGNGSQGVFIGASLTGIAVTGLGFIFSLAVMAMLAIVVGFAILLLRRMIIIALLIMSPIAIVASILPNTDGLWKAWKGAFEKLLYIYPVIMILIASGRIFSYIASDIKPGSSPLVEGFDSIMQFAAVVFGMFAPYVAIPFAFRYVGGFAAQLGGMVNDRSRGMFDRSRKKRAEYMSERKERASRGKLYANNNMLSRAGSRVAMGVLDPKSEAKLKTGSALRMMGVARDTRGPLGKLARSGDDIVNSVQDRNWEHTNKLMQYFAKEGISTDKGLHAIAGTHAGVEGFLRVVHGDKVADDYKSNGIQNEAMMEKVARGMSLSSQAFDNPDGNAVLKDMNPDKRNELKALVGSGALGSEGDNISAQQITGLRGKLNNLYKDNDMNKGSIQGAALMSVAAQGFAEGDDIARVANNIAKADGVDYAEKFSNQAQYLSYKAGRLDLKPTYGVRINPATSQFYSPTDSNSIPPLEKNLEAIDEKIRATPPVGSASFTEEHRIELNNLGQQRSVVMRELTERKQIAGKVQGDLIKGFSEQDWYRMKGSKALKNLQEGMITVANSKSDDGSVAPEAQMVRQMVARKVAQGGFDVASNVILTNVANKANITITQRNGGNGVGTSSAEEFNFANQEPDDGGGDNQ